MTVTSVTVKDPPGFADPAVKAVFDGYPEPLRSRLLFVRAQIFDIARSTDGVGPLDEVLKWGQPSYLAAASKSGSTIRLGAVAKEDDRYALFFHCQTTLGGTYRDLYDGVLTFGGNRSIVFDNATDLTDENLEALRHCISLALTYHLAKKKG